VPITLSPLRYPGGKTKLFSTVKDILKINNMQVTTYIEPFAGGSGLALKLLLNNEVKRIIINDIDPSIYNFWYSVLNFSDELCSLIKSTDITLEVRERQRKILLDIDNHSSIEIGFATLFLNRTSRSGIIAGGPIGGKNQNGSYLLDERFNKNGLIEKVKKISSKADSIKLYGLDVLDFIDNIILNKKSSETFINFDPPYVNNGRELYLNHFNNEDHARLAEKISALEYDWIVTYDNVDLIKTLYKQFSQQLITVNHTAGKSKVDKEILIYSSKLRMLSSNNSLETINMAAL
jgi:DNA adenine methylase